MRASGGTGAGSGDDGRAGDDAHGELLLEIATDGTLPGLRRALDQLDEQGAEGTVTLRRPTLDDVFLALTGTTRSSADSRVGAASMKESA